jgi:hypothetical protein
MMTRKQILHEMELIEKRQASLEREHQRYEAMLMDLVTLPTLIWDTDKQAWVERDAASYANATAARYSDSSNSKPLCTT